MHDIRFIREQPDAFDAGLTRRGLAPMAADLLDIPIGTLTSRLTRGRQALAQMLEAA